MKSFFTHLILILLLIVVQYYVFLGCGVSEENSNIKFKYADGDEALVIKKGLSKIEGYFGEEIFTLKAGSANKGKRIYKEVVNDDEKSEFCMVKNKEYDTIKVMDPSGNNLFYKIKYSDDKVKISDNDEGNNAFVINIKEEKAKLKDPSGNEIASAKVNEKGKLKVKASDDTELFTAKGIGVSAAPMVLPIDSIPPKYRAVIINELFRKNNPRVDVVEDEEDKKEDQTKEDK